jgi:hypothetical protein
VFLAEARHWQLLAVLDVQQKAVSERKDMISRMQQALLIPFDEAESIQCQEHCQREMQGTLDELHGLVLVAEMPPETRVHLMQGLFHIESHIKGEIKEMIVEVEGRRN